MTGPTILPFAASRPQTSTPGTLEDMTRPGTTRHGRRLACRKHASAPRPDRRPATSGSFEALRRLHAGRSSQCCDRRTSGRVVDPESGLIYLRNRYYDPTTASFLTKDPLAALTQSPYGYTHGNPINRADPSGLDDGCNPGDPNSYDPSNPGGCTNGAGSTPPGCDHGGGTIWPAIGDWAQRNFGTADGLTNFGGDLATWSNRAGIVLGLGAGACAVAGTVTTGVGGVICGAPLLAMSDVALGVSAAGSALQIAGGVASGNHSAVIHGEASLVTDLTAFMVAGPFAGVATPLTRGAANAVVGGINETLSHLGF